MAEEGTIGEWSLALAVLMEGWEVIKVGWCHHTVSPPLLGSIVAGDATIVSIATSMTNEGLRMAPLPVASPPGLVTPPEVAGSDSGGMWWGCHPTAMVRGCHSGHSRAVHFWMWLQSLLAPAVCFCGRCQPTAYHRQVRRSHGIKASVRGGRF